MLRDGTPASGIDEVLGGPRLHTSGETMNFDLTRRAKSDPRPVPRVRAEEVAPQAERNDREERFPYELVQKMAELGLMGLPFPEKYGGAGRRYGQLRARGDGDRTRRRVDRDHPGRARLARRLAVLSVRHREAKARVSSSRWQGARSCGVRPHRARRRAATPAATQTRAELRDGRWVINGTKAFITNCGTDITGGTTITAVTGASAERPDGDLEHHRAAGHARLHALEEVQEDGLARVGHARAGVHRRRGPRAENLLGERGKGLQQLPDDPRRRPHLGRGALGRARDGRVRRGAPVREGAPPVRPADLEVPGDPVQARRHADRDRARASSWCSRRRGRRTPAGRSSCRRRSRSCTRARCRAASSTRRVQIHGGYGFMDEYPISRMYRDQKINEIGEGTNEVQRLVIARMIGL